MGSHVDGEALCQMQLIAVSQLQCKAHERLAVDDINNVVDTDGVSVVIQVLYNYLRVVEAAVHQPVAEAFQSLLVDIVWVTAAVCDDVSSEQLFVVSVIHMLCSITNGSKQGLYDYPRYCLLSTHSSFGRMTRCSMHSIK